MVKRMMKYISLVLSLSMLISLMIPMAQASVVSQNTVAYIEDNGDLVIHHDGMETRVTVAEEMTQSIIREYHDAVLYQEIVIKASEPDVMMINDFSKEGMVINSYEEKIPGGGIATYVATLRAGKEYVGKLSGRALSLNDPDNDFDFSVRVWNEITDSGQTSYTLPNVAKTAAAWAALLAGAAALALPALGIGSAIVANCISGGTLIYTTATLLCPELTGTVVSCNYSSNQVSMTPATTDPIYRGRTVQTTGSIYFVKDAKHPATDGEVYRKGLMAGGISSMTKLGTEIFDYLYGGYDPSGMSWDRA